MDGCVAKNSSDVGLEPDVPLSSLPSTLIDSTPGVLAAWDRFGREYDFDGAAAAHDGHGRRLAETLGELCNLETPEQVKVRLSNSPARSRPSLGGRRAVVSVPTPTHT